MPGSVRPLIVISEDEKLAREDLEQRLVAAGYQVEAFDTGQRAVERYKAGGVDLILLDIVTPGLSGLDCCRLLKSMAKDDFLPVVLVTSRTDTESRVEGLRIGADDYVCKPFDTKELTARIDGLLRIKRKYDEVREAREQLATLAVRDELTGLYNYRYLHTRLSEEFARSERYRDPLACAMVDIDHFKQVNDNFGHDVGDVVLSAVAERLKIAVREIDVVARYGGEEFLLVLPSTHFSGALTVADRVWRSVGETPIEVGDKHSVTVSIGVALYPSRDVRTKDQLLKASDQALYQAKADGRNRICVYQHQGFMYRPSSPPLRPSAGSSRPPSDS